MTRGIPLSKDGRLCPHLTYCPRCGGETNQLYVGQIFWMIHKGEKIGFCYKRDKGKLCKQMDINPYEVTLEEVDISEKLPATDMCDDCKKRQEAADAIVRTGGIYFVCRNCGSQGAIRAGHPFSAKVRRESLAEGLIENIDDPVGASIPTCPHCEDEEQEVKHGVSPSNGDAEAPGA